MQSQREHLDEQLLKCLRAGEKSLAEIRKLSKMNYSSLRRSMMRLMKSGTLERHWDGEAGKNRRYLYRLRNEQQ